MKINYKLLILILSVLIFTTAINVEASTGYSYDHRGQPIYSTNGLTVNQAPYLADDLKIPKEIFTSPQDLFIYEVDEDNKLIYIIDSVSNILFVFDQEFKLITQIDKFKVTLDNFDDKTINEIKSSKKYVIARDLIFSISNNMEKLNLAVDGPAMEIISVVNPTYEGEYDIEWKSSNPEIVEISVSEDITKPTITAKKVGKVTIEGKFVSITKTKVEDDETGEEKEEVTRTVLETISITVSTNPEDVLVPDKKHHSFSTDELAKLDSFDLHLSNVSAVYRAVNPNTLEDYIYLCDKGNNQVVVIDSETYEVVQFVTTPDEIIFKSKLFAPNKIVTDGAGRMYIIADNVYEGILQFSKKGEFNRFTGVNYVTLTPWEIFWRNFSTEAQLEKQSSIINTSFTSLTVDDRGFIYTTAYATTNDDNIVTNDNAMIKKINTAGKDVLRRNGYQPPKGDVNYIRGGIKAAERGPSKLSGIAVNKYGMFTVVDSKMGRLFTYDNEGKLLYVSGEALYISQEKGKQINVLSNPVAISYLNENIIILDKNNASILTFEPTDIGKIINKAAEYEFTGDSDNAADTWEEVVRLNANYEYGYIGIGKKYIKNKDYKTAMAYFEKGADRQSYSKAYKLYRDGKIRKYFAPVIGTVLGIYVVVYVYKLVNRKKYGREDDMGMGDE